MSEKAIVSCAMNGVLTNPYTFEGIPVTPEEMASSAKAAYDQGASIMHIHFRDQNEGMGMLPTWDADVAEEVAEAIRQACPGVVLNFTTGIPGPDISGPEGCLRRGKPEMAALNAGSLNYLKLKRDGNWAWAPMLFDNPVDKIEKFAAIMDELDIVPECECFDTGIVRSVGMFQGAGILDAPVNVSFVTGVASGMPCKPEWIPLLVAELPEGAHWQTIAIGREDVWDVHRQTARLGGNLRTGVEDTFYLPDGSKAGSNGRLIEELVKIAREEGREIASPDETRAVLQKTLDTRKANRAARSGNDSSGQPKDNAFSAAEK